MNGGSIIGIRPAEQAVATDVDAIGVAPDDWSFETEDDVDSGGGWRRIAAGGLIVFALAWIAACTWFWWQARPAIAPAEAPTLLAAGAIGPLLAGVAWLLLLRTSTAEAQRFGATARAMRAESRALEHSVAVLGTAIEDHRVRLAEQMRTLSQLGDTATARLSEVGRGISEEIDQADVHARALAQATTTAHDSLAQLLALLPRAEAETAALTGAIDAAAQRAGEHAASLDAQVTALGVRGQEAGSVAAGAAEKLAALLQRMDATSKTAGTRLEGVAARAAGAVDGFLEKTAAAMEQSRQGIEAQGDAMLAMVHVNQQSLDSAARESAEALAARIDIIEQVIERIAITLGKQRAVGDTLLSGLDAGIAQAERRLDALHAAGVDRTQHLAVSISALGGSADAMTNALALGEEAAHGAIATTERLLTAFDAAAREMDETLPEALARLDRRVRASHEVIVAAKPELLALVAAAESTHEAIAAVADVVAEQRRTVDALNGTLQDGLDKGRDTADAIGAAVDDAAMRANRLSEEAAPRLLEALLRVRETANAAAEHARQTLTRVVPEVAETLEQEGGAALRRVVAANVAGEVRRLSTSAEEAAGAAERAAERLGEQLAAIDATVARVEERLAENRAAQEERDQDSFARRASLLIEALNSASIDLTRTLAPDVSDSAWAAYLKGDRGVFTRRAVRLLDGSEQRELARLYDGDATFREQVNRYIHDFEAMLRTILAQRDGSPLGVTLLSSDMGKLYVALAQAIERLR